MCSARAPRHDPRSPASPVEVAAPEPPASAATQRLADLRAAFDLSLTGAAAEDVLRQILKVACAHFPDSKRAAVFVHHERIGGAAPPSQCLRCRVGIGLDPAYITAVEALDIGPGNPSCLSVMYTGQRSLVCDLPRDPLWKPYLSLASEHRIGAVWSFPVRPPGTGLDRGPLGTLAVYFESAREPAPGDLDFLELLASSAGLILDRERAGAERNRAAGEALALRAAQAQLRETSDRYRASFELAHVGQMQLDPATGRFLMVNDAYCEITGRSREELLTLSLWDVIHPGDMAEFRPRLLSYFRGDAPTYSAEKRYLRPDGRTVWVRVNAAMVLDPSGRPDRSIHMVEDITARREAERALRRSNAELDRFASFASHDLKEPLRGISALTAFVLEDEPALGGESRGRLNRIQDLSRQLSSMIDGLLEYARAGGRLTIAPCDLREVAIRALDKLRETVRLENAHVHIDPLLPRVRGDCVLLERVLANLINNALKYNPSANKEVHVGFAEGEFFVRDNGDGIDPAHHDRIFGVFVRLDAPGAEGGGARGTGLGLALVKRVMEGHGGSVRVESVPGRGSTFYLRFPHGSLVD